MERNTIVQEYLQALALDNRQKDFLFLCDLVARHVSTFSFSSVSCQLGDDLPLDIESLYKRIVIDRRGGYCFEQNGLLYEILEELGFAPKLYLARVIHNQDIHPGLTHRITIIKHKNQQYIIDVGFGSNGPRIPVLLSKSISRDGDRMYRITERLPGEYHMQIVQDGDFYSLYRFELCRYGQADCELGHFYSHRHPAATFVNHLVVSRLTASEIRSLHNLEYSLISTSGTKKRIINNARKLQQTLVDDLKVQVSDDESHRLFTKHAS
jgi:N-hydroxyarylamine O-acetyltransferase